MLLPVLLPVLLHLLLLLCTRCITLTRCSAVWVLHPPRRLAAAVVGGRRPPVSLHSPFTDRIGGNFSHYCIIQHLLLLIGLKCLRVTSSRPIGTLLVTTREITRDQSLRYVWRHEQKEPRAAELHSTRTGREADSSRAGHATVDAAWHADQRQWSASDPVNHIVAPTDGIHMH